MSITESAMLCLQAWRAEVHAGRRSRRGWRGPSPLLRNVVSDADAFEFVRDICDYVALPEDAFTAALGLHEVSQHPPDSLPTRLRIALRVGGIASFGLPWGVVPLVKGRFRAHLFDILVSGELPTVQKSELRVPQPLRQVIEETSEGGSAVDIELLGQPIYGVSGVDAEVQRLIRLARTPGLDRITVTLSRLVPEATAWSADAVPVTVRQRAAELFDTCARERVTVTIAAHSYVEALLMPALVRSIQEDARFIGLRLGVEVLAELPEAAGIIRDIAREALADSHLEIRLTDRSIAANETIRSIEQGLAVPTLTDRDALDRHWAELLTYVAQAEVRAVCTPVIATEDITILALAQVLWQRQTPGGALTVALTRGRAPELSRALVATGITVHEITPYVHPAEFPHALPHVLSTLAVVASSGSAFHLGEALLGGNDEILADQRRRLTAACTPGAEPFASHRRQDRAVEWSPSERDSPLMYRPPTEAYRFDTGGLTAAVMRLQRDPDSRMRVRHEREQRIPVVSDTGFANEPDTDAALAHNRDWMREVLERARRSQVGEASREAARTGVWALDSVMQRAFDAAAGWSRWTHTDRATVIRRGALSFVAARDRLTEVIASERGLPVTEVDHEIGVAVDAARYAASRAEGLRAVRGATFTPVPLTLIVSDELSAPGELAEMLCATLAAGSAIVLTVHETIARTAAVMVDELTAAGIPEHVITLVVAPRHEPFDDCVVRVMERPELSQVLATVNARLAERMRRSAPILSRDVRVRSHGTIIVTPAADMRAATTEIVRSALSGAGFHHRAAQAVIAMGGLAKPGAFLTGLREAVQAVVPGDTDADPLAITLAPLPEPATEARLRALTELADGESWLVAPQQLDDTGRRWSPGVRLGVAPDATFWSDAIGAPVIGIVTAHSLSEAIELQHRIGGGGVAAMHSLNADDFVPWLEHTNASALALNKATTGARIERFPAGVWRDAQSAWQSLAGGPNRLAPLGHWALRIGTHSETLHLKGLDPVIRRLIEAAQPDLGYEDFDLVRRAALADELTWRTSLGSVRDASGLSSEHNLLRYRRVAVHVRFAQGAHFASLVRVVAAGILTGAPMTVSSGEALPDRFQRVLDAHGISRVLEQDEDWLEHASIRGSAIAGEGEAPAERIRLIGGDAARTIEWLRGRRDVSLWAAPVTMAGPVELLSFLREQAISVATTRHGMRATIPGLEAWVDELHEGAIAS